MPPKAASTPVAGQKTLLGFFAKTGTSSSSKSKNASTSLDEPVTPSVAKRKPSDAGTRSKPMPTPVTSSQGASPDENTKGKKKGKLNTIEVISDEEEEVAFKPQTKRRAVVESDEEEADLVREKKRTKLSSDIDEMDLSDPVPVPKARAAKVKAKARSLDEDDDMDADEAPVKSRGKSSAKSTDDDDYFDDDPELDDIDPDAFIVPDDEEEEAPRKSKSKSKPSKLPKKKASRSSLASEVDYDEEMEATNGGGGEGSQALARFEAPAEEEEEAAEVEVEKTVPSKDVLKARKKAMAMEAGKRNGAKEERNEEAFEFLRNVRDADGHPVGHPEYDPRTLFIPPNAWKKFTPFEKQFWEIKRECFDTILFFQKGKFYELYEDDATIGHREFDLKLTDRVKMRMVGVPEGQFPFWANKFIARGYKVGRVDQCETAIGMGMRKEKEKGKGGGKADNIVKRELKIVLTSGTAVEGEDEGVAGNCLSVKEFLPNPDEPPVFWHLSSRRPYRRLRHLRVQRRHLENKAGDCVAETEAQGAATIRMLKSVLPDECQWTCLKPATEFLTAQDARRKLRQKLHKGRRKGRVEEDEMMDDGDEDGGDDLPENVRNVLHQEHAMSAMGGMMWYLDQLNLGELITTKNFTPFDPLQEHGDSLLLDGQTLAHIEVLTNSLGGEDGSLLRIFTKCATPFGKRLFRKWLCAPLRDVAAINDRLDTVTDLMESEDFSNHFAAMSKGMPDLERLLARVHSKSCSTRDFKKVLEGFTKINKGLQGLSDCTGDFKSERIKRQLRSLPDLSKFITSLQDKFVEDLEPVEGADEDFDAAVNEVRDIEDKFDDLLQGYRKQLKLEKKDIIYKDIGVNEIYQVQVPAKTKVPDKWHQMSATKQVKRYWPPEVSALVKTLKESRERKTAAVKAFQSTIFEDLAKTSAAMEEPKVRPDIVDSERAFIDFEELRHPCLQTVNKSFIPNNVQLGVSKNMILLTGPNMAGKSTLLRMTCVGVILAQLGCYVPAAKATISPVDKIETRMGANDLIFQNSSTFKVEMDDAKRILTEATPKSLVILDELGRGTSTHDGVAIAHAVLHRLATHVGCIGFFATHYTSLVQELAYHPQIRPCNMKTMVDDETKEVVFLYQLEDGASSNSYGPHVAKMAGLPIDIVSRAIEVSKTFDQNTANRETTIRSNETLPLALQADAAWLMRKATSGNVADTDNFALQNICAGFNNFLKL
ncbi:hypothetical protein BT69DRAFT_1336919 [Atractiella rhizophila]|nr:hypothetical protein BT69DRAFT_1336919 [Atractiella rhizophila]